MAKSYLRIIGYASLMSNLPLEEVGAILSQQLFGGVPFGGKGEHIHEEIPAVYIPCPILGLQVILEGYSGLDPDAGFNLQIRPWIRPKDATSEDLRLDSYLTQILKIQLKEVMDIVVVE